jgi:hypothetical protein
MWPHPILCLWVSHWCSLRYCSPLSSFHPRSQLHYHRNRRQDCHPTSPGFPRLRCPRRHCRHRRRRPNRLPVLRFARSPPRLGPRSMQDLEKISRAYHVDIPADWPFDHIPGEVPGRAHRPDSSCTARTVAQREFTYWRVARVRPVHPQPRACRNQ